MNHTLLQKLLILFFGVFLYSIGVLTYLAYQSSREAMLIEFKIRGRELAQAIASESRAYYRTENVEGFTSVLQSIGEAEGVLAILAYDENQALWIESSIIDMTKQEIILNQKISSWHVEKTLHKNDLIGEFGTIVSPGLPNGISSGMNHPLGWIRVFLDRLPLEERLTLLLWRSLGSGTLILLGGGALFVFLLRRSLRIIKPLIAATQEVGKGNLTATVQVTSQDELGQLAQYFNQMTKQLHQTTVSKNYMDTIINSMVDGLIVIDVKGTIQTINRATVALTGQSSTILIGQPLDRLFPPDACPIPMGGVLGRSLLPEVNYIETHCVTRSGQLIPISFAMAAMADDEGQVYAMACVIQDIRRRKQAEDALKASHGLLKSIEEAQAKFISSQNLHTTFHGLLQDVLSLTESGFGFIGEVQTQSGQTPCVTIQAMSSMPWDEKCKDQCDQQFADLECINPESLFGQVIMISKPVIANEPMEAHQESGFPSDYPSLRTFLGLPIRSGKTLVGVVVLANRPGGYDRNMVSFLQPILSTCGNLIEAFRMEKRRAHAEYALRESVERFDLAVQGSRDGIWDALRGSDDLLDPQGPVYYSPRFKQLLGYEDHEFENIIASWFAHLYPEDRQQATQALVDHLVNRVPYDTEYRMVTKSGEIRWFAGRGQAVWDEQGIPTRISGSFSDITDRKRAEAALHEANQQLREIDQLRTQFFADISHELRTPLTVIRGEAEVTLRGPTKSIDEYQTTLKGIVQLTSEVNRLVEDLLFLARSEAGTIQIRKESLVLLPLVQECVHAGEILAQQKQVAFESHLDDNPTVYGDPQRLKQAFMILIDNAIKYTDCGGMIGIRLLTLPSRVKIQVFDTGIGIPQKELPHVFKRFYRVKRLNLNVSGGAGLGLPIAKWIIEAHQGDIMLETKVGEGTTATVYLPLHGDGESA